MQGKLKITVNGNIEVKGGVDVDFDLTLDEDLKKLLPTLEHIAIVLKKDEKEMKFEDQKH